MTAAAEHNGTQSWGEVLAKKQLLDARLKNVILSNLLRGMARRVDEVRQSLRFADAHIPQWERIISERQNEIELLRVKCHENGVRATEEFDARQSALAELEDAREQIERTRRAERRSIAAVLTGMLDELETAYVGEFGDGPAESREKLHAVQAFSVDLFATSGQVELDEFKPNPWFTPAEFPLETAERQAVEAARRIVEVPMISAERTRERKADGFRKHYENVARIVEAVATNSESLMPVAEARHRLLGSPDAITINGPGTYPLHHGGSLIVRVAERGSVDLESLTGTAEFDAMFPPACGQIHDGVECLEPRVPEANGCWAHYGPEVDAPTVRTDRAEESPCR